MYLRLPELFHSLLDMYSCTFLHRFLQPMCVTSVILVYYFTTTLYTCMLVEGLHICIKLKTVFATAFGTKKYAICLFVAWGNYIIPFWTIYTYNIRSETLLFFLMNKSSQSNSTLWFGVMRRSQAATKPNFKNICFIFLHTG